MAYKLVQGDTGPQIRAVITRDDTGEVVDMSGATVRLRFRRKGTETVLFTLTAIDVGQNLQEGVAVFGFTEGDLDLPAGNYEGELEITFADSNVETVYELLEFDLREEF